MRTSISNWNVCTSGANIRSLLFLKGKHKTGTEKKSGKLRNKYVSCLNVISRTRILPDETPCYARVVKG